MKNTHLTVKSFIIAMVVIAFQWNTISGQVTTLINWTNLYHGPVSVQQNIDYPIPDGTHTDRALVVAIASDRNSNLAVSVVNLTYGGQALVLANGDMGTLAKQHTALYYLNEAGLHAATSTTLAVTISGGTIGTTDIWAAVYDYVNQTITLADSKTYSSMTTQVTSFSFGTALTINAYNQAVEVVTSFNPIYNQIRTITYATDWTMANEQTGLYNGGFSGFSIRNGVASRALPASNTTDISTTTFDKNAFASMTALSLKYHIPPPPTEPAGNVTFSGVTSTSFTINWTPGNGTKRLVLVKAGSAVDGIPVDFTTYTASNVFGSGSLIGNGNYVVYNENGNSVTVTDLDANTTYHVAVFEFSGPPGIEYYLTLDPARGSQLTGPETAVTGDYRTKASGNWGALDIWQRYSGSSWDPAGTAPNLSSGIITIRNGHTVSVADTVTVDQVVIEASGQVNINPGITLKIHNGADAFDCNVNGTLSNAGIVTTEGVLAFKSGSTYHHAMNGGTIPAATWDANSMCSVTGITTTAPAGFGQSFGHFTWNCLSQNQNLTAPMNSNTTVQGNLTITSTGSGKLAITDGNTPVTLTVLGNFTQTGGIFDLNNGIPSTALDYLKVAGNFSFTGGTITESSSSGRGAIIFNGTGLMQTFTSGGTINNTATIDFTVESGAYLQMGTGINPSHISGSKGTFTLSAGATLGITDHYGITAGTSGSTGGNIRVTGTRNFSPDANYIYNGSGAQNTGSGLPLTINNLVFNNTGGVVTFNAARTIADFSINTGSKANLGIFTHNTSSFSLGGVGQETGTYGHSSSTATFKNDTYFDAATGIVDNKPSAGTWIGITSTDWNIATNWAGGVVPGSGTDAIIPSGPVNQPVVLAPPVAECNNLSIKWGASVTVNPGQALTVHGNLNNSGTLNLNSSETGIASLIPASYTDHGTEKIEIYLTGGGNETNYPWHYISSPVTSLSTDIFTTGPVRSFDLAAYYENLPNPDKDLRWIAWNGWDYSTQSYPLNPVTFNNLEPGKGYNIYFYESSVLKTFGGTLNTSDETEALSYTTGTDPDAQGWNCLGNPFSSGLDWDAITKPDGMANAIYFTVNNTIASYVNGVSTNGGSGLIPPMQGFFVKANQTGVSLTLPASARVHTFHSRYKGEAETIPLIRLKIESQKAMDETVIRFDEKANIAFDSELDAYKFGKTGNYASLWTAAGSVSYSINSIPFPETKTEVPVGVNILEPGNYKLSAGQLNGIDNYDVYLTDKLTRFTVNLRTTPSLSFNAAEGTLSDRFVVKIVSKSVAENPALSETSFNLYSFNGQINIQTLSDDWDGKTGSIGLVDMTGREISRTDNAEFWKNSLIQIPATGLKGVYFVKMRSGLMRYVGKVMVK